MPRAVLAESEAGFQAQVVTLATYNGWMHYHAPDNGPRVARSGKRYIQSVTPGFPDLVLLRPPELLMVECKRDDGRVSPAQREWLAALAGCGVEVHVWRPRDWTTIEARLQPRLRAA